MNNISAIILAKNEQDRIKDCLDSLLWTSEQIVVDNGSTDKTILIAKKHGARVISEAKMDFASLRQFGLEASKSQWVLYVDADEIIPAALKEEILTTIEKFDSSTGPHGYFITRKNYYLGHLWPITDCMERLFLKKSLHGWKGQLHESPIVDGAVGQLQHHLVHDTHRTLWEMVEKTNLWSTVEAKLRLDAHHPPVTWWRLIRVTLTGFFDSYLKKGGYRAGSVGWIESIYQGYSMFITYGKLWEMQELEKEKDNK